MSTHNTNDVERHDYKFLAVLTLTSPLHITSPEDARVDLNSRFVSEGGFPCQVVVKAAVANAPQLLRTQQVDGDAPAERSPYTDVAVIPANTLRGALRRQAAYVVCDKLQERGEKLSVPAFNVLLCGASSGKPEGANPTVDEMIRSSRHPYFGLFGGGPRMLSSRLRVDMALPVTGVTMPYLDSHFESANMGVAPWQMLQIAFKRRNDDLLMMAGSEEHRRFVQDYEVSVNEYQDQISVNKATRASGGDAERGVTSFSARQVVKTGTHFAISMELRDATPAQAGLLLAAISGLVKNNRLGGGGALGLGHFMLQNIVVEQDGERASLSQMTAANPLASGGSADELLKAWHSAAELVSAGEIEEFVKPLPKAEKPESPEGQAGAEEGAAPKRGRKAGSGKKSESASADAAAGAA